MEGNPPTFATAVLPDPNAFPTTTVHVHNYEGFANDQRFWLSVRIRQQDAGVEVTPEPGYAQMGLIAPGGDAIYTVTFPEGASARVEFEVDGSTEEAVFLTLLQFALEAGFTTADLAGVGGLDADISRDLAEVVAEQYLADLPSLAPCANAVAAVQRGINDQEQFTQDMQRCLESPMWQASVDEVLTRAAKRDGFQQAVRAAGLMMPALGTALKGVQVAQFAAQLWGMYEKFHPEVAGAMVGTVAFINVDTMPKETLGAATAVPELSVYEVVGRAQEAVQQAGTYKYELIGRDASDEQTYSESGEVVIGGGRKFQNSLGFSTYMDESGKFYSQENGGAWFSPVVTDGPTIDSMTEFLGTPVTDWSLLGTDSPDGRLVYVIERLGTYMIGGGKYRETYWIDTQTFLPLKEVQTDEPEADWSTTYETFYFDFGAPVDVAVPQEALAPTPTPEPASPLNSSDPVAIAEGLLDAIFAEDLDRISQYFALDDQRDSLADVFGWSNTTDSYVMDLIAGCRGSEYTVVERGAEVVFVFPQACAKLVYWVGGPVYPSDQIRIYLEASTGTWYVTNVIVGEP